MKIILYGPPGIGKTTIIRRLADSGRKAYDLEDLPDLATREAVLDALDNCFVGGADTTPAYAPDRLNVLLTLPQEEYETRRTQRDQQDPDKADQKRQNMQDWAEGPWNLALVADQDCDQRLIDMVDHQPNIHIYPKPHKSEDNWTPIVAKHHDSVEALMSYLSYLITERGRSHDIDKLNQPNPDHGAQPHHWYRPDHSSDDDVDLLALLESVADTVATTWGRYLNNPWERELWSPPEQTSHGAHDIYTRTVKRLWDAAKTTESIETFPGFFLYNEPIIKKED